MQSILYHILRKAFGGESKWKFRIKNLTILFSIKSNNLEKAHFTCKIGFKEGASLP